MNAFNLGVVEADRIFLASASGVGNPVIYAGSKTGRDGIHGASLLASAEFDETTEQKRPTVQVGDPFTEKCLIEACLELMRGDDVVGIQDMGAAGLTCSSFEMASRGGHRHRDGPRPRAAARGEPDALRAAALGEPGAHAARGARRARGRGLRGVPSAGASTRSSSGA